MPSAPAIRPSAIRPFTIRPWTRAHQEGVVALISGIQRGEFGLPITPADQPDLMDIDGFYRSQGRPGAGEFWVAEAAGADGGAVPSGQMDGQIGSQIGSQIAGQIIGCIALLDIGNAQAALRKMFVHADWRGAPADGTGRSVAAALLGTLLAHAREKGLAEIFLGTTTRFLAAHRFYEKHGFARVEKGELPPAFPVMAVDTVFYRLAL